VAMDPAIVLRQAGVSVSRELDFGAALPFTMGTSSSLGAAAPFVGLEGFDSEFQDCAGPTASASGFMGGFSV